MAILFSVNEEKLLIGFGFFFLLLFFSDSNSVELIDSIVDNIHVKLIP